MGQKETMAVAEEIGGGTLRRMILVVTAVALMAVMLLAMAMPAFADQPRNRPGATGNPGIHACRERQFPLGFNQREASFICSFSNEAARPPSLGG